jgi:hypothetical protein
MWKFRLYAREASATVFRPASWAMARPMFNPRLNLLCLTTDPAYMPNRLGVKIVAYIDPNALYKWHPLFEDVAIRQSDGSRPATVAYNVADSCYVCINHPRYRALLVNLLKEVFTNYGPAGLYVDGLTPHRCFCEHCRKKYREMWGQEMPVAKLDTGRQWCVLWEMVNRPELVGDPNDPDTPRYTQFLYESLAEVTGLIAETVKQVKPDAGRDRGHGPAAAESRPFGPSPRSRSVPGGFGGHVLGPRAPGGADRHFATRRFSHPTGRLPRSLPGQ